MRLRVATLNVWALPEPLAEHVSERMQAIGARLPALNLDAMAFQEVWTGDARKRLVDAGRRAGLENAWHNDASLGGSGLLVLSRLPIQSVHFERFSIRCLPNRFDHVDYYGRKGFVRLRLETDEGPLTLIDTHLQARYRSDVAHEYRAHRAGQIVQLAMDASQIRDPVVALGDFNLCEEHPEYAVLTGLTGFRDIAAELDRREATVTHDNAYRGGSRLSDKRIDYVFARDGADRGLLARSAERIFEERIDLDGRPASYSDHAGVLAKLEIAPRALPAPAPSRRAIAIASELLSEGCRLARRRQRGGRVLAGGGIGCAALAAGGLRTARTNRRTLLRLSLQGAALLALTPGVGYSILSEVFLPDELRAFEALAARLSKADWNAAEQTLA